MYRSFKHFKILSKFCSQKLQAAFLNVGNFSCISTSRSLSATINPVQANNYVYFHANKSYLPATNNFKLYKFLFQLYDLFQCFKSYELVFNALLCDMVIRVCQQLNYWYRGNYLQLQQFMLHTDKPVKETIKFEGLKWHESSTIIPKLIAKLLTAAGELFTVSLAEKEVIIG